MGLAICRRLIEAHGGRIEAGNHETGGARFSFSLPALVKQPMD
jgi:signal transduction histidine kinase